MSHDLTGQRFVDWKCGMEICSLEQTTLIRGELGSNRAVCCQRCRTLHLLTPLGSTLLIAANGLTISLGPVAMNRTLVIKDGDHTPAKEMAAPKPPAAEAGDGEGGPT